MAQSNTVAVYLALVTISSADWKTLRGMNELLDAAAVLLPGYTRDQLLSMPFDEFVRTLRDRADAARKEIEMAMNAFSAMDALDNILGGNDVPR